MEHDIRGKDYQTLLNLYNHEIDTLREQLLNGEPWDNLKVRRRNIKELAMALHRAYGHKFPGKIAFGNPAELPQPGGTPEPPEG